MKPAEFIRLDFDEQPLAAMEARARSFRTLMGSRRSVREFSTRPVSRAVIEHAIMTAASAPSGANQQPWTFVCIESQAIKAQIRAAAEAEERAFYEGRAGEEWLGALAHLGTDASKPFLTDAPWLIVLFAQRWSTRGGKRIKHYYVPESVGIAAGFLIAALHHAGLATLTHTPAPMGFLTEVCGRPESEKPMIILPVGYPAENCTVPLITRKPPEEVAVWL
jgi:iodotyrosine deiodinase